MKRIAIQMACAALCFQACANAELLNVSKIVTGTEQNINWVAAAFTPNVFPSANISNEYMGRAMVQKDQVKQDLVGPGPWGPSWGTWLPAPNVTASVVADPITKFGVTYNYSSSSHRSATVNMTLNPRYVGAMTFGTGNSEAAASYSYKIDHFGAAQDYFMSVQHPAFQRNVEAAYVLTPGSNGGTYVYYKPTNANSRAAVEIYADGLPIWSSETAYHYPNGQAVYAWDNAGTSWGKPSAAGFSTLYLGKFNAGMSVTITMVVRTATAVKMDSCAYDSDAFGNTIRCHKVTDAVKLSNLSGAGNMLQLFTKVL